MRNLFKVAMASLALLGAAACASTDPAGTSVDRNLSGTWNVLNSANYNIEAHPGQSALQLREGPVVPVPAAQVLALGAVGAVPAGDSVIVDRDTLPYKPDALAMRDDNKANYLKRDPEIRCYQPGVPRANYIGKPFKIFQSDEQLLFIYEYANAMRNVHLEDPGEAEVDSWMGQSFGYWEDDTFVIEVTAQNGQAWLDRAGNHYSYATTVTERFKKIDDNHIRYEATIDDPETYTEPFTISMILYRQIEEDAELHDFNCVPFVEELIYGHLRKEPLDR